MRTDRFIKSISLLRGFEAALAAVLLAAVAPSAVAQAQVPAKKSDAIHEMGATFQELAKRVSPAIVEVMVTGYGAANEEDENASSAVGRERSSGIVRFAYEQIRKYGRVRRRTIGADLQSLTPDLAQAWDFPGRAE
jgi:hypothetical protein